MNFVDFVIDCYSHITSHVSQAFASCTHYTSYSLLNFVHVIVCVFGLTNQVWKYFENYAKHFFFAWEFKGRMAEIFFGETGIKTWVFEKAFHLILMHFVSISLMLWGVVFKIWFVIFKIVIFLKNFVSLCPVRSIEKVL